MTGSRLPSQSWVAAALAMVLLCPAEVDAQQGVVEVAVTIPGSTNTSFLAIAKPGVLQGPAVEGARKRMPSRRTAPATAMLDSVRFTAPISIVVDLNRGDVLMVPDTTAMIRIEVLLSNGSTISSSTTKVRIVLDGRNVTVMGVK